MAEPITLKQRLQMVSTELDAAAAPTKSDVFTVCGSDARQLADDIRSLLSTGGGGGGGVPAPEPMVMVPVTAARLAFEALRSSPSRVPWAGGPYTVEWGQYVFAQALGHDDHDAPLPAPPRASEGEEKDMGVAPSRAPLRMPEDVRKEFDAFVAAGGSPIGLHMPTDPEWYRRGAELEEGHEVGAGRFRPPTSDLPRKLRDTLEAMGTECSVDMALWDRHSNAVLLAALIIESFNQSPDSKANEGRRATTEYNLGPVEDEALDRMTDAFFEALGPDVLHQSRIVGRLDRYRKAMRAALAAAKETPNA